MILWVIVGILLLLSGVMLLRTVLVKSTPAKTAKAPLVYGERAQEYGKELAQMVQKETVSSRFIEDRSKFYEFHKILENLFPFVHANCEKMVFNGSLLFKWKGKSSQNPIMLMSHHDVVEANGRWDHEPFSGDIDEKGRIWGRGTVDTKASLYCIFKAVEELLKEEFQPECDIYISSSCTEEWSGEGAPLICEYLKNQGIRLSMLLDEGGMIIEEPIAGVKGIYGMVGIVEKGYGDVKFIAKGKGGHASAPGKNTPLVRLGKFMTDVEKKNPFHAQLTPVVKEMFSRLTPNMDFGMKLIFANIDIFKPLLLKALPIISPAAGAMLRTTIAFTMAQGADGLNVLPQEAYVTGNMRFIQHQPNKESLECVKKIAEKYDIQMEIITQEAPCPIVDYKGESFRLIENVAEEVYPGIGICPYVMTGGTDAKFYSDICENTIRFAPLYIDNQQYESIHGINENIYQEALPNGVDFYKTVIRKVK